MTAPLGQSVIVENKPSASGTSPAWAGLIHQAPFSASSQPATVQARQAAGVRMPIVASAIPPQPPIAIPITLAERIFGPGAAWASA